MPATISDQTIDFASVLAWTAHLDHLDSRFNEIANDDNLLMEKTCWAEELAIGVRVLRNYAMRTLADHYVSEASDNLPLNHKDILMILGDFKAEPTSSASTIEEILELSDAPPKEPNALAQDPVILGKLYIALKHAVSRIVDTPKLSELELESILSKLLVQYISSQQSNLRSANAFEGLASEITTYLKGDSPAPCDWNDVRSLFKSHLQFHLEISSADSPSVETRKLCVSRLRENGNNLMINTCYPQAVQTYTDAIHLCDYTTRSHLPQLYTNRAIAYIGLNCFREAVHDLIQALRYDRTFLPAWAQMGYCQLYLGFTMSALKCYLAALRSVSGEIYPYNFPADEEKRNEYTEARALTVMPQFVQKLVLSFILAVKRAEQQRESSLEINQLSGKARAILARLRSHVEQEDLPFLAYSADPDASSLRSAAMRSDTIRPSILTPDVAQDIISSANVEASAVTISNPPEVRNTLPIPVVPLTTAQQVAPESGGSETSPETSNLGRVQENIRGFLNTLGNVVGDAMQELPSPSQEPLAEAEIRNNEGSSGTEVTTVPSQESSHQGEPTEPSHIARALMSVRHALRAAQSETSPASGDRPSANTGMISALRHQQAAMERMLNVGSPNNLPHTPNILSNVPSPGMVVHRGPQRLNTPPNGSNSRVVHLNPRVSTASPSNRPTTLRLDSPTTNTRSPSVEDTEMPDAPDVD